MSVKKYPRSWRYLRRIAYKKCVERDGELCTDCHKRPVKEGQTISDDKSQVKILEVDHVNANKQNNPLDGSNWALRCHKCNSKKNTRGHAQEAKFASHLTFKVSGERGKGSETEGLQVRYIETAKNLQAQPLFDDFTDSTLKRFGFIKKSTLLDAAANHFKQKTGNTISQQALSRYAAQRTNPLNGDLIEEKDPDGERIIKLRV